MDGDARFDAWNGRRLDFDNLLSATGDQDVGGHYEVDSLSAGWFSGRSLICSQAGVVLVAVCLGSREVLVAVW